MLPHSLKKQGICVSLLFENGAPLESAILEALRILGFSANNFDDGKSEFDAIFESAEGRLLGEAEGKDSKPINVEKLRQLSMNIQEDLERNEVTSPAKGVLFGNGYRLIDPRERGEQFTDKCMAAASTTSVALVSTNQLFLSVKYLLNNNDENYARLCREAIFNSIGIVSLPTPPEDVNGQPLESVEDQG